MLRLLQEAEYVDWMAALKLACRGRTMADTAGYQAELHALRSLLRLHHNCPSSPAASVSAAAAADGGGGGGAGGGDTTERVGVRVQDLVAARHCTRLRHKQVREFQPRSQVGPTCMVWPTLGSRTANEQNRTARIWRWGHMRSGGRKSPRRVRGQSPC